MCAPLHFLILADCIYNEISHAVIVQYFGIRQKQKKRDIFGNQTDIPTLFNQVLRSFK